MEFELKYDHHWAHPRVPVVYLISGCFSVLMCVPFLIVWTEVHAVTISALKSYFCPKMPLQMFTFDDLFAQELYSIICLQHYYHLW